MIKYLITPIINIIFAKDKLGIYIRSAKLKKILKLLDYKHNNILKYFKLVKYWGFIQAFGQ